MVIVKPQKWEDRKQAKQSYSHVRMATHAKMYTQSLNSKHPLLSRALLIPLLGMLFYPHPCMAGFIFIF